MSESKQQELIRVKYKPISMVKVFGKDRKEFQVSLHKNSNAKQIIQAFLQIQEVDQIFNTLQKIGRKVDMTKINFILGGKKLNIDSSQLEQVVLSDSLGKNNSQVSILITSSQSFADKDIASIIMKKAQKEKEQKKIDSQPKTGFVQSSHKPYSLFQNPKNVKVQSFLDRSLLARLRNMNYSEQMSLIAVNEVKKNHEGKKQPNLDQAMNYAIDFIEYLENDAVRKAKEISEYQKQKKEKLDPKPKQQVVRQPPPKQEIYAPGKQMCKFNQKLAPQLTKYDIKTLNIQTTKNSSSTFSWGNNFDGQLGINSSMLCSLAPHPIFQLSDIKVKSIVCGGSLTLFLTQNGQVLHCGKYFYPDPKLPTAQKPSQPQDNKNNRNNQNNQNPDQEQQQDDRMAMFMRMMGRQNMGIQNHGPNRLGGQFRQLGGGFEYLPGSKDISSDPRREYGRNTQPKLIIFKEKNFITKLTAGIDHCLAIDTNGNIFSWGNGINGQLGHGFKNNQLYPRHIESVKKMYFTDIAAGAEHSMALTFNGDLLGWGSNNFDQLGNQFSKKKNDELKMDVQGKQQDDEDDDDDEQQQQQSKSVAQSQSSRVNFRTYVRALRDQQQKQELKGQNIVLNSLKVLTIKCSSWSCTAVIQDSESEHSTAHRLITWGNSYVKMKDITDIISQQRPARIPIQYSLKGDSGLFITKNNELARYDYSQGKVIERFTSIDKIIDVSAGSDFFSVKTSEGNLLQKGKNKSGQLGNGNTESKQELLSHSLSIGGDTVQLFDSGFKHTVVVFDNSNASLGIQQIRQEECSKIKTNEVLLKGKSGICYRMTKIICAYLFQPQALSVGVELALEDDQIELLVQIIRQIRQQRSIYYFILNENQFLTQENLEGIEKFLNSFAARRIFRASIANLLSQSVEQIIKLLKSRKQQLKEFYSTSENEIVKAKLSYINFIHKANEELRIQRRNQRIRRQEEERKHRADQNNAANRLRQLEQRGQIQPVQAEQEDEREQNEILDMNQVNNEDQQDNDEDENNNQDQQAARQRYMQARNQYQQIVQRRAQQQQQQRGRGNQFLGRGGLGIRRPGRGGRGGLVDMMRGRFNNMNQPRGVHVMRNGQPVQLNNNNQEGEENEDGQQQKNQAFSGTGVSLSTPNKQSEQKKEEKEVQSPEDLRQKRLNLFRKQK